MSQRAGGTSVLLDLNSHEFQNHLFALGKEDQRAVMGTLAKLSKMTWQQVYADSGLHWEAIVSRVGPHGRRLYSFRAAKGIRGVAFRQDDWLRILTLHPDKRSAVSAAPGARPPERSAAEAPAKSPPAKTIQPTA